MKMNFLWAVLVVGAVPVFFSSCDKDEEVKPSGVTFKEQSVSVTESDGTVTSFHPLIWQQVSGSTNATGREIKIELALAKAMPDAAVVEFSLSGSAVKNSSAAIGDYDTDGNSVVIEKGATTAFIPITLFEDLDFEYDESSLDEEEMPFETLIVTLTKVVSGPATLGEQKEFTMRIYEDDAIFILDWEPQDDEGTGRGDVDLDLFVWDGEEVVRGSVQEGNEMEITSIPGGFPSGEYGLSYTYYSGTSDNVQLNIQILNFGGSIDDTETTGVSFSSTENLTLANINKYDQTGTAPIIVQSIEKDGLDYPTISALTRPTSGSRSSAPAFDGSTIRKKLSSSTVRPLNLK